MVDTKTPGDKTLSVPTKTLTLKPRVETGTVRQSFSHGRTKQVVVEKRGKRRVGGDAPGETHAPEPVAAKPAPVVAKAPTAPPRDAGRTARRFRRGVAHADRGRTFRARQRAGRRQGPRYRGTPARGRRSQAPQQQGRHRAGRTRSRRSAPQGRGRTSPPGRGSQAQGRTRSQEALWRSRSQDRNDGRTRHHRAPRGPADGAAAVPPARAPGVAADGSDEDEGPRQIRRGPGGVMRPAAAAQDHPQAGPAKGTRPPDAGHRAERRRRARALDRLVPPPHPAPEGTRLERAEGKARSAKW